MRTGRFSMEVHYTKVCFACSSHIRSTDCPERIYHLQFDYLPRKVPMKVFGRDGE
jgi:hypothetical protein